MIRKRFLILLLILSACLAVLMFAACDDKPEELPDSPSQPGAPQQHDHDFVLVSELPATCTTDGSRSYLCACGESKTDVLPKLGHDLHTQTDDDFHWQACSRCDFQTEQIAHNFQVISVDVQPDCTHDGQQTVACSCGKTDVQTIGKTAHNFTVTDFDNQAHWQKCSVCQTADESSRTEHTLQQVGFTPSTCTVQGSKQEQCACGYQHTTNLDLADHQYTLFDSDDSTHWRVCSVCNGKQEGSDAAHVMQLQSSTPATCTEQGVENSACVCGKTEQKVVEQPLGHSWDTQNYTFDNLGHTSQCIRCTEKNFQAHTFAQCDCPDGKQAAATCGAEGHGDKNCTVCGFLEEYVIPATGQHTPSNLWQSDENAHWHLCSVCSAELEKTSHTWQENTQLQPTCTENGIQVESCSQCGKQGKTTNIPPAGHDMQYDEASRVPATCKNPGRVDKRCTKCGFAETEILPALQHEYEWKGNEQGHWKECLNCDYKDASMGNHDMRDLEKQPATCTDDGFESRKCHVCGYVERTILPKHHNWCSTDEGRVDPTCVEYGSHREICNVCGEERTVIDTKLGFAKHSPVWFEAKAATMTERGWNAYWQCTVCKKYFQTKDCKIELSPSEVFLPALRAQVLNDIAELNEVAAGIQGVSSGSYQITLEALYKPDATIVTLTDGEEILLVSINDFTVKLSGIGVGDKVTVCGKLKNTDDGGEFVDAEIIEVRTEDEAIFSVYVRTEIPQVNGKNIKPMLIVTSQLMDETYFIDNGTVCVSALFNCTIEGDEVVFNCQDLTGGGSKTFVISRLLINGRPYTMTDGILTLDVTEDIHAEFVFAQRPTNTISLNSVDTTAWDVEHAVDPYVSYRYIGGINDDGRLYANSHLRFTLNNAYLTRLEIEFEDFQTEDLASNELYFGKDETHKTKKSFSLNGLKLVVELDPSEKIAFWEYSALSQARIKKIKFNFETYNSCQLHV